MADKDETPGVEDAIRLAIEAANAANDAADEVDAIKSDVAIAADKTDAFRKRIAMVVFGVLGGTVVAMALSSLVYFRTISEMRKANATQIEALALFAESVDKLNDNLDAVQALSEGIVVSTEALTSEAFTLTSTVEEARSALEEDIKMFAEEAAAVQPDFAASINEHTSAKIMESDNATMAALADLLDRLSTVSMAGGENGAINATTEALIEQIVLLQEQELATQELIKSQATRATSSSSTRTSSTTTRRTTSSSAPNPFKFP